MEVELDAIDLSNNLGLQSKFKFFSRSNVILKKLNTTFPLANKEAHRDLNISEPSVLNLDLF